jgi:O-methyltransferase
MIKSPQHTSGYECYKDLLIRTVSNTIYQDPPLGTWGDTAFDREKRLAGHDWPSLAHSMAGTLRLTNLADLVTRVLDENVPGDLIETGVWRGGSCILMRGLLKAYGDQTRSVFAVDSFAGLPPPDEKRYIQDKGDTLYLYPELAVSMEQVKANFAKYGLLDDKVQFLQGLFKDTLPTLRGRQFALIRLDGDMYESTMDSLVNLYDTVPIGGFVVIDDYGAIAACREAVSDFRTSRGISEKIETVDWTGAWWRKLQP